jgi:hypothetical protein
MKFTTDLGTVEFVNGVLTGEPGLVLYVQGYIKAGVPAGCDYWGEIAPSLESDWKAYLSICGALSSLLDIEPDVDVVPANPDGYDPEGPTTDEESQEPEELSADLISLEFACYSDSCRPPTSGGTGGSTEGIAGLQLVSGQPLTRKLLENGAGYFLTLGTPETFSGWKAHVYADNVDDAIAILHRVRLDIAQPDNPEGWGAKVATQQFFDYTNGGHKQRGKAVTLYFPKKANVEKDIEWLVREMEGIPKRQQREIEGDDYRGNGVSIRFELSRNAPDRDLDYQEYQKYYEPS